MKDNFKKDDKLLSQALDLYQKQWVEQTDFNEAEFEASEKFEKKMKKLIKSRKSVYHRMTFTTARKVACIIAAILIMLLASLSVGAVRDALKDMVITQYDIFAKVAFNSKTSDGDYPKKIEKIYELGSVPDGYKVSDYSETINSVDIIYRSENPKLKSVMLSQNTKNTYKVNYDNENSIISHENHNNQDYIIVSSKLGTRYIMIWDNGDYIFTLTGDFNKEEILELCESLKIKEN